MDTQGSQSPVLRRKTHRPVPPDAVGLGVANALSLAFERAARESVGLSFQVDSCRYSACSISDLPSDLPDTALWCLLENGAGGVAAMAVDTQLLAGLVEFQTLGCVLKGRSVDRPATRVDGALVMSVADEALMKLGGQEPAVSDADWVHDYRYGAMTESKRALILSLTDEQFHLFQMQISLEGGAKSGRMTIAFPTPPVQQEEVEETEQTRFAQATFQNEVHQAPAVLNAVLARISLPFSMLKTLQEGEVLTLPADCLNTLTVEMGGQVLELKATLGRLHGMRALRLNLPLQGAEPDTVYDPVAERPETPDEPLLKETEGFLPPVEEIVEETALSDPALPTKEDMETIETFAEDGEDFSDMEDLNLDLPQLAAG